MRRRAFLAATILAILGMAPAAARAHAFLDHAEPAVGSLVETAPEAVRLWFTAALDPAGSEARIVDRNGDRVDLEDARIDPATPALLRVSLKPLRRGTYRVIWRTVSADGHASEGDFTFEVTGEGAATPQPPP